MSEHRKDVCFKRNQDFAEGRGLNAKSNFLSKTMSFFSRVQSKLVQLKDFTDESLWTRLAVTGNHRGIASQTSHRWAIFVIFSKKLRI